MVLLQNSPYSIPTMESFTLVLFILQGPVRTSIYYQRPRNMNYNRVFTDYKNLLLSRLSLAAPPVSSKPLTFDQPTILQEKSKNNL